MIKFVRAIVLLGMAAIVIISVSFVLAPTGAGDLDTAELSQRVNRARVTWADYGEGIKAELGATPAALWHGAPESARLVEDGVEVTFSLTGPWSGFDFGIPILLRDPEGKVLSPQRYTRGESGGTYRFAHSPATPLSVPWVELKFPPNDERRIVFDADGVWTARVP